MVMGDICTDVYMYIVQTSNRKKFSKNVKIYRYVTRRDFSDVKVSKNISVPASPPATENKKTKLLTTNNLNLFNKKARERDNFFSDEQFFTEFKPK